MLAQAKEAKATYLKNILKLETLVLVTGSADRGEKKKRTGDSESRKSKKMNW